MPEEEIYADKYVQELNNEEKTKNDEEKRDSELPEK